MKNTFETKRNVWEIVPYKPYRKSAMYEYERGAKYKLYRKTDRYNICMGLFSTKHAAKQYAMENDFEEGKTMYTNCLTSTPNRQRLCVNRNFRYITSIWKENGMIIICGIAGMKKYLWYPVQEAIKLYNADCKGR